MLENQIDVATPDVGRADDPDPWAPVRKPGPVRRVVHHELPAWLVTRFNDVEAALRDPRLSSDQNNASAQAMAVPWLNVPQLLGLADMMIFRDPPTHTRLRRLVSTAFTPRRLESMRPRVHEITTDLLNAIRPRGRADILYDFSYPLAIKVIMELIGIQLEDIDEFQRQAALLLSTDPADQGAIPSAMAWMRDYILALVQKKQSYPGNDLLSDLIRTRDEGNRLSHPELGSMTLMLLMAGHETTANLIGNGVLTLLNNPDQLAALRADPILIPAAIEEMLRYDGTAAVLLPRHATDDLTIGEVPISKGDTVLISLAAAGRDPQRYTAPDTFDIHRTDTGHLGFGHGIHYCLGAPLARMEAQIAFPALLSHLDNLALAAPPAELSWRIVPNLRSLTHLPVTFTQTRNG
jgi:cytochrome P450